MYFIPSSQLRGVASQLQNTFIPTYLPGGVGSQDQNKKSCEKSK